MSSEDICDDCELKFIHCMFSVTDSILGSACGQQSCDHVILFFSNHRVKSTVLEAGKKKIPSQRMSYW